MIGKSLLYLRKKCNVTNLHTNFGAKQIKRTITYGSIWTPDNQSFFSDHRIMNWNEKRNLEWFNTFCKMSSSRSPNRERDYKFIIAKCTKNNSWNHDKNLKLVGADSISWCGKRNANIIIARKLNLAFAPHVKWIYRNPILT